MIRLIIGLGNPGLQYLKTRHNLGAFFVHALGEKLGTFIWESKFRAHYLSASLEDKKIFLLLPGTYMNQSGSAVQAFLNFYKIQPNEFLVAHDELDLLPGHIRLKLQGGHAGHNGLRNIIQCIGTSDFARLRIGIGKPVQSSSTAEYVLSPPAVSEQILIQKAIQSAVDLFPEFVQGNWDLLTRKLHTPSLSI